MAEDWIPISVALPSKPEVVQIATLTKRSPDEVVGVLIRFWSWAQQHSSDGTFPGMTKAMAAAACHISEKFLNALELVGWLTSTECGISIPNFDRWLGRGAKSRFLERQKKRMQRAHNKGLPSREVSDQCTVPHLSRVCPEFVPNLSREDRDKNGTTLHYSTDTERGSIPSLQSESDLNLICIGECSISTETEKSCGEVDTVNSPPSLPGDIAELVFPCEGSKGQWRVPPEFYGMLKRSYQTLDVDHELRKAYAWLMANPGKRKTSRGMTRFLVNWLNRAVDCGVRHTKHDPHYEEDIYA